MAYKKAGGKQPEEDEMCAQLMKILPANLSFEMLSKADDMGKQSSDALIYGMRAKSAFISEHGSKEIHIFLPGGETGGIGLPGYSAPTLRARRRP